MTGQCFVIQPFDGSVYDKRYRDVIAPAILDSGLEPYRVDGDPSAEFLIDQIEAGIRAASACVAEISEDNPNVWFELGFAIALGKPVVLLCSKTRTRFPFDIQHRAIVTYETDSTSDFDRLRSSITSRLTALRLDEVRSVQGYSEAPNPSISRLTERERRALELIAAEAESLDGGISAQLLVNKASSSIPPELARGLLLGLVNRGLVVAQLRSVSDLGRIYGYSVSPAGLEWLRRDRAETDLQAPLPKTEHGE